MTENKIRTVSRCFRAEVHVLAKSLQLHPKWWLMFLLSEGRCQNCHLRTTDCLQMPNLMQKKKDELRFPNCGADKQVNIRKGMHISNQKRISPAKATLYRNAGSIALKFFVVEVWNGASYLLKNSIYINVCVVVVKTLRQRFLSMQNWKRGSARGGTCTMVAAPLSISAREKLKPQTMSCLRNKSFFLLHKDACKSFQT